MSFLARLPVRRHVQARRRRPLGRIVGPRIEPLETRQLLAVVSSDITADTTWTVADSPYEVTRDIDVIASVVLTIEPGVEVQFRANAGLTVQGRIVADGTPTARIHFGPVSGGGRWAGLTFANTLNDNRISFADMEFGDQQGAAIEIDHSRLLLDNLGWTRMSGTILEVDHPSLIVRNSSFPTSGGEVIHGSQLAGDEYLIVQGNTFANSNNGSDVIDFLGAARPGPVLQILDNVFLGGGDDGLDLDGTDAHIEGNVFMNFRKNTGRATTSNAIATGLPQDGDDNRTEITVTRNVFIGNDHALLLKEDAFATVTHNVFVGTREAVIQFNEVGGTSVLGVGKGADLQGNIFWNNAQLFKNLIDQPGFTTLLLLRENLLPNDVVDFGGTDVNAHDFGVGNRAGDPLFVDAAGGNYLLQPDSPARAVAANGLDLGAFVPSLPTITEHSSDAAAIRLQVAGPGITHYRYRLNDGKLGPLTGIEQLIEIPTVDAASQVTVHGMNSAGEWVNSSGSAGFTHNLDQPSVQLIAPRAMRSGESLPIVARTLDWQQQIESTQRGLFQVAEPAAVSVPVMTFKKGVAAWQASVTATADFELGHGTDVRILDETLPVTEVMGTLAGEQIWSADQEYRLTSDVTVAAGARLTIEPGARVIVDPQVNLFVHGSLQALGTAESPILFAATTKANAWGGLHFVDAGTDNELRFAFFTDGGADASRNFGHSDSQPVILSERSTVTCDNCFVIDNVGKAFGARNGFVNIWNSVIANADTGGEFISSVADIRNTWLINIPNAGRQFVNDDNDGFYFSGVHASGEPSRFQDSFVIDTLDDGLDHNGARLQVAGAWVEGAVHEGIASSNRNWVTVDDSVFMRNNQGIEAGYGEPDLTVTRSVVVGNRNQIDPDQPLAAGIRFGDGYDGSIDSYRGHITAREVVLHDNIDNIRNFDGTIPGPQENAIDIAFSLLNDADAEFVAPTNISRGVPVFSATMHLLRGGAGFDAGPEGMPIGRPVAAVQWSGASSLAGDFDLDGVISANDIAALCDALRNGDEPGRFDITNDGDVDAADRDRLILELLGTTYGDSNLDGRFDSSDLVAVFVTGEYEDQVAGNSGWADGDWDCDGDFNTRDLVLAFSVGGYES